MGRLVGMPFAPPIVRPTSAGRILAVLLVAPFVAQADATIANVATPSIHADLGASGAALELIIGGYLIAFAVLLITGARLGQTHGYRRLFLIGIVGFGLTSLACGLAPSPAVLVVARVLQGASAALVFPQTLTGIQLTFEGPDRVRAVALYAMALSMGAVVGQVLGGVLVAADVAGSHWRAIFLVNVPVAAVTAVAASLVLPRDELPAARRVDRLGVATLSATCLLVVVPLAIGRSEGWPAWAWLCLAAAVPAGALFVTTQRRSGGTRLVNLDVLARPSVGWALAAQLVATGTYYALLFTLAQYLQQGLGHTALASGLTLVPWVAAFGVAGQVVRRLPARVAARTPVAGCLLLTVAYGAISAMLFRGDHREPVLLVLLAAGGLGLGINFSALVTHLTNAVPSGYAADISGVSSTTSAIGGAIGVAAFGTLYLAVAHHGAAEATHAFAIVSAGFAAAALAAAAAASRATAPRPAS